MLTCTATGDTPLVYHWTMEGSTTVLNSDNTTGTLELADIQENQFRTYVCTVTNDLGMATSEVILEQAGILLTNSPCYCCGNSLAEPLLAIVCLSITVLCDTASTSQWLQLLAIMQHSHSVLEMI